MKHFDLLKTGQDIVLCNLKGTVCSTFAGYYIEQKHTFNNALPFEEADIPSKLDFQKRTLGYLDSNGLFPFCRTLEDLTKLCNALQEEYTGIRGYTYDFDINV